MYTIYILKCANGSLYTGYTNNLEKRIESHNAGKGAKYTRAFGPVTLASAWELDVSKSEILSIEAKVKKLTKEQKESLCKKKCRKSFTAFLENPLTR